MTRYLARNPSSSHVALIDGNLVGAVLAGQDGRRGFLYHLAVSPEVRGRGIARELVQRSLKTLKERGVARAFILVAHDNDDAFAFWKTCGWDDMRFARPMGVDL